MNEIKYPEQFRNSNGNLFITVETPKGTYEKKLCNFTPRIAKQLIYDDGVSTTNRLVIDGIHSNGKTLPEVTIQADELSSMKWLLKFWDANCNLEIGQNTKEQVRYAIQTTADDAKREYVYAVTGWKKIDGQWQFLLPKLNSHKVELNDKLKNYGIEYENYETSDISVASAILELEIAEPKFVYPILSDVFISPLNEFLRNAQCEPKSVTILIGKTGSKKSSLAALMMNFFGVFTATTLPLSFKDTQFSIVDNTYYVKDVLTVVDDFHPTTKTEAAKMTATAQAIVRAYGDRVGRGRLKSDATPNQTRHPQGNAIITAEFMPDIGESGNARTFIIEMLENTINLDVLTIFQEEAQRGALQKTMLAYIGWIKEKFLDNQKEFEKFLQAKFLENRDSFRLKLSKQNKKCHDRIPEMISLKLLGFEFMLEFFEDKKLISLDRKNELMNNFTEILIEMAIAQSEIFESETPTKKFIKKLVSLIEAEVVSVPSKGYREQLPQNFIGFQDDTYFYLNKDMAHKAVKKLCEEQGESFTITATQLLKYLAQEQFIEVASNGDKTKSLNMGNGRYNRFVFLKKSMVEKTMDENLN